MSVEQVKKFLEEVATSEELQAKMAKLPLDNPQTALTQGIAIAKEAGFVIEDEVAKSFFFGESQELCDIELDHVAGGRGREASGGGNPGNKSNHISG